MRLVLWLFFVFIFVTISKFQSYVQNTPTNKIFRKALLEWYSAIKTRCDQEPISRPLVWQLRHKRMQSFAVFNLSEICLSGQSWDWWASLSWPLHYYKAPGHNYCWPLLFLVFSVIFHSIILWKVGNWIAHEKFMIVRFRNHGVFA